MKRVSARLPWNANSFQTRVPTGKTQALALEVSICLPSGSEIQRCLSAPSVHSAAPGVKPRLAGWTALSAAALPAAPYRPLHESVLGSGGQTGTQSGGKGAAGALTLASLAGSAPASNNRAARDKGRSSVQAVQSTTVSVR